MSKESDKIRADVEAVLALAKVAYAVQGTGPRNRDGWECDSWICTLTGGKASESFEYFTGTGHRKQVKPMVSPRYRKNTVAYEAWAKDAFQPVAPHVADLLHSLILDSSASEQSFESWANEYGYDTDSRKAEDTYRACQKNADKLTRVLGPKIKAQLSEILWDY